ncbi:hypothetical protein B0T20DRAFT_108004 [Sordaria brevicollis]|uniref:Uncharacterized protein n=1 Tax=Sordaria brevicollis TaxID=83679 RepID=A0AAE0U2A5_SORBR|nr:hypothetical protein B0T20DRAFT_108004 [Sordaria brevicollis]
MYLTQLDHGEVFFSSMQAKLFFYFLLLLAISPGEEILFHWFCFTTTSQFPGLVANPLSSSRGVASASLFLDCGAFSHRNAIECIDRLSYRGFPVARCPLPVAASPESRHTAPVIPHLIVVNIVVLVFDQLLEV